MQKLVQQGIVEPGGGARSSLVVLVRMNDGSWRLYIDSRRLNAVIKRNAYPLPRIDDNLDALMGSMYFSTLDFLNGHWQVPLEQDAQENTEFVTRGGLCTWKVLPFGLSSAPDNFEGLIEMVLKGLQWKVLLLYLDDVIVLSSGFASYVVCLDEVLQCF